MTERPKATEERRASLEELANELLSPEFRRNLGRYREARNLLKEVGDRKGKGGPVALSKEVVGGLLERFELKGILSKRRPETKL